MDAALALESVLVAALCAATLGWRRRREPLGADESYLLYGVHRLLEGRWPHRDFRSYEPGRYAWCALALRVLPRSLAGLRLASHLFWALGATTVLLALSRAGLGGLGLVLTGSALALWAHPQHKLFEPATLMLAIAAFAPLVETATPTAAFGAGIAVGFALTMGFNLFLYAALGLAACGLLVGWHPELAASLGLGFGVGAGPVWVPALVSPAFARAAVERRVRAVLRRGSSNLPLPVPWPWRPSPPQLASLDAPRRHAFRALWFLVIAFPTSILLCRLAAAPAPGAGPALVVAAAAVASASWHHAVARADPAHLAQVMAPPIILASALGAALPLGPAWGLAGVVGLAWLAAPLHPGARRRRASGCELAAVAGSRVWMPPADRALLAAVRSLGEERGIARDGLLALPDLLLLYVALDREAPVYDVFCVYPATGDEDARMVDEIRRSPALLAVVSDAPLDGREELRFSRTHPEVWRHLEAEWTRLEITGLAPAVTVFLRRSCGRSPVE